MLVGDTGEIQLLDMQTLSPLLGSNLASPSDWPGKLKRPEVCSAGSGPKMLRAPETKQTSKTFKNYDEQINSSMRWQPTKNI